MAKCTQHFRRRLIREYAVDRVGKVWRQFECNNCHEVGVQRAGSIVIEWTGTPVKRDERLERRVYKAPHGSRQRRV